nr:histidine phosphatase family protein [Paracoccus sp. JM45]
MHCLPPLYLMRHGQTFWNAEGRLQGALDSPLTPLGVAQAKTLQQITAHIGGCCVSSPQGRAQQTSQLVFAGRDWTTDNRLSEIGIGGFAGRLLIDVQTSHAAVFKGAPLDWYNHCPNGEGFAALANRCRSFLTDLQGSTLVVTHGITLRMLRLLALGRDPAMIAEGDMGQGIVYYVKDGVCEVLDAA